MKIFISGANRSYVPLLDQRQVLSPKHSIIFSRRFSSEKSPTITVASFFRQTFFTHRVCTTFCELFTFTKSTQYLILNASKGLYLEMQNPEGSPFPIFRRYETFSAHFFGCETFFRNFLTSSKGPPSFFRGFATEWMLKRPKGPPFTFFGTTRLLKILIFRFFWKIF